MGGAQHGPHGRDKDKDKTGDNDRNKNKDTKDGGK
jgi:hypothetical protein